ncbi:MAG: membrane protein insertion efficiency factor YidD [Thermoanaerobaculia bacterium]|nr:membrane protein insertion efficiency factor YidD [Thermoanaerobaculia bacterium]
MSRIIGLPSGESTSRGRAPQPRPTILSLPSRLLAAAMVSLLVFYKRRLSPMLPRACRFTPTCSEYARLAILEYGPSRGSWLAIRRVLRCHPLHPGGVDLP